MNAALEYLLKANLFLVLFYACYWIWLRKHTFFRLNRVYLLGAVLLSLTLPLVELPAEAVETMPVPMVAFSLPVTVLTAEQPSGPDWETIGFGCYGFIAAVMLLRLLVQVTGVGRLIKRSERHPIDDYTLVLPADERVPTFSFFRYLVLCRRDAQTANTPIVAHELVHIRQGHSFDVLLLETVQLFFWMNPVLILYKQSIQQVHEFLADAQAEDKHQYATFLIDYAFGVQPNTLTNGFFKPSLLKERIRMLQRRATSRWALGKYILVMPLLLSLLAMTTAREELTNLVISPVSDDKVTVSGKVSDQNGKPLPNATLIVMNTTSGAQTDAQGRFELKNVSSEARIVASHVGFAPQIKEVSGKTTLDFTLTIKVDSLRSIVVVAFEPSSKPVAPAPAKTASPTKTAPGKTFTVVEQNPEYPGGMSALGAYLSKTIRYPAEAQQNKTQGTVYVQFTVGTDGDIQDLRVKKGIGSGCDEEAIRVVSQMPHWKPGIQSGKPVMTQFVLPIQFQLEKSERSGQVMDDKSNPANVIIRNPLSTDPTKKPLFIVDGRRLASTESLTSAVEPMDGIKSINVLKGASATTIYGNEGKDGVIEVTTKQKAMSEIIQVTTQPGFGNQPVDYTLDGKTITREEFQKLNPNSLQRLEVDHTKTTYTIKATSKN